MTSPTLLSWQAVSAKSWVTSVRIRLLESPGLTNGHFLSKVYFALKKEISTEKLSLRDAQAKDVAVTELWDLHPYVSEAFHTELW